MPAAADLSTHMQNTDESTACLEQPFAHASSSSAHQAEQAEVVISVKLGFHDVQGALSCCIQAHVAAHVMQ